MSYVLPTLVASAITAAPINLRNAGDPGAIIVYNNSQVVFQVDDTAGSQYSLPNGVADLYVIARGTSSIRLTPIVTVSGTQNNANSVTIVFMTTEELKRRYLAYPITLGASFGVTTVLQVINDINSNGATVLEAQVSGNGGSQILIQNNGNITTDGLITIQSPGGINNIPNIAGVNSAGQFGVPLTGAANPAGTHIINTTATGFLTATGSLTSPTVARISAYATIGAGNTNQATISMTFSFTDPILGVTFKFFYNVSGATALNGSAVAQGASLLTIPMIVAMSAGSSIACTYRNTSAGTISDWVYGAIEFIG